MTKEELEVLKQKVHDVMHADAETIMSTPWMAKMTRNELDEMQAVIAKAEVANDVEMSE